MREKQAGERVDGYCQSAIGFSIWWISPPGNERQLNRDPVPSSIPCPDNSSPVLTAPLTVTGWWLVTMGVICRTLLKCHTKVEKKVVLQDVSLRMDTRDERLCLLALLRCSSQGASHTFKPQQTLQEDTLKPMRTLAFGEGFIPYPPTAKMLMSLFLSNRKSAKYVPAVILESLNTAAV